MLTQALIIGEPWIGHIMAGRKTWEMRSRATTKRGPIALVRKGSGLVVAIATLAECRSPLIAENMAANFDKHQIPQSLVLSPGYKWFTPWVLNDIRPLSRPVPYHHPGGAVTFVNLTASVIDAIKQQARSTELSPASTSSYSSPADNTATKVTTAHLDAAARVLDGIGSHPTGIDLPADATVNVLRRGNKLYIDAVWDDKPRRSGFGFKAFFDLIGIFSVVGLMLCTLIFILMVMFGIVTFSITFFHAFYAVPPLLVFAFIAGITGHLPAVNESDDRRRKSR